MLGSQELHIGFRHLDEDYDINKKGEKSDHSVKTNGISYTVLSEEKLDTACKILESVSLDSITNAEDLQGRLFLPGDISFSQAQKIDEIGMKTLETTSASKKVAQEVELNQQDKPVKPVRIIAAEQFLDDLKGFSGVILVQQGKECMVKNFQPTGLHTEIQTGLHTEMQKFDENTPFNIASVGKWFTGVAILQLVDQKKIRLDDPVSNYLEQADYRLIGAHHEYQEGLPQTNVTMLTLIHEIHAPGITIRELLTMKSGLIDGDPLAEKRSSHSLDRSEKSRENGYSNYGYQPLARFVQNKSGMSFPEYIKKNVLLPSRMSEENVNRAVYDAESKDYIQNSPVQFELDESTGEYSEIIGRTIPSTDGNGCYWMSSRDLLIVSQSIIESEDILKSTMRNQMLEGELGLYNKSSQSKGFTSKFYGRPGEDLGMSSALDIIEGREGFTYSIILSNQNHGNECRAGLRNTMLRAEDM